MDESLAQGPLDLSWKPSLPTNWWEDTRQKALNAPPSMGGAAPSPDVAAPAAQGPPSAPAAVEQPKLAQLTPTTSTGESTTPELGPLHDIGRQEPNIEMAPAYGAVPSSATGEDASKIKPPMPQPSKFQSFLSTMRDVATGRPSDPNSIAGQVRGGFGHWGDVLGKMAMATAGPSGVTQSREQDIERKKLSMQEPVMAAQAKEATARAAMAGKFYPYTDPRTGITTMIPISQAGKIIPAEIGASAKRDVAKTAAESKLDVAQLTGDQKAALQAASAKQNFMSVPGVGLFNTKTQTVIPGTEQGAEVTPELAAQYRIPHEFLGRRINLQQLAAHERSMVMGAPKISDTTQWMTDINGELVGIPKRTTVTPQVPWLPAEGAPGAPAPAASGAAPKPAGTARAGAPGVITPGRQMKAVGMQVGTDPEGHQIAGTPRELKEAGATNTTTLPSGEAAKVNIARQLTSPNGLLPMIDKDLDALKPEELSVIGSRWNEFMRGTIGKGDPRYTRLYTHLNGLLDTAVMQAHVGASGGFYMMDHFKELADAGRMTKATMKAAIKAEKDYMDEKAMRPQKAGAKEGGPKVGVVEGGYRFKGGNPADPKNWEKQ